MLYRLVTSLSRTQKGLILIGVDTFLMCLALVASVVLITGGMPSSELYRAIAILIAVLAPLMILASVQLGLHRIKLNAYGMEGVRETAGLALGLACVGILGNVFLVPDYGLPNALFVVFGMLFLINLVAGRIFLRRIVVEIYGLGRTRKRVLIYGAGQTGQQLAMAMLTDDAVEPVAFVDDNTTLQKLTIAGLKVHSQKEISNLVQVEDVDRIILAMPSASQQVRVRIGHKLRDIGCEVQAVPSFAEMILSGTSATRHKPIELDRLLGRDKLEETLPSVSEIYSGKRIFVSGAGGSIGSELCRQLLECQPECLVIFDHSELALYKVERELRDLAPTTEIVPVLGSVCYEDLVAETLSAFKIQVVLHAAAYKHLPLVEENALEGLRNNVIGTKVLADMAVAAGIDWFIQISTDKAVRPTSVMGGSKRMAEMVVQDLATRSNSTRFAIVRFGNVLGSSGSVIPLFESQIQHGGPVTVTHSDVTRYFMTVSEAVRLVLLAGSFARGGDVFALDMGKPVNIRDVARQLIENAGLSVRDEDNPEGEIEIQITGLRPGEKLHEELLIGSDMLTTPHPKILRAEETGLSEIEVAKALSELRASIASRDEDAARRSLMQWLEKDLAVEEEAIR